MGEQIRVLVVDDEAVASDLERAADGFVVTAEPEPRAALDRLESAPIDCLVSEYDVADSDGLDFLRTVRERDANLPFVLFTDDGNEAVASEAFAAGATDYVRKGVTEPYAVLAERVESAVAERRTDEHATHIDHLETVASDVMRTLVRTDDATAAERAVCERLSTVERYAWIAIGTLEDGEVSARTVVADDPDDFSLDSIPAVRTALIDGTPAVETDGGDAVRGGSTVAAMPLTRDSTRYGALVVGAPESDEITPAERDVLETLSDDVANTLHRLDVRADLRESEAKYRRLVEQNLVGVYVIQDDEFVYVNPRLAAMFGYTQAELLDVNPIELVVEDDRETFRRNVRRRESGEVDDLRYTLRGRRRDGSRIEFEVHGGRIDYRGEPAIMGTLLDVTEQKRYERELERSRAEYRELFEGLPEAVFLRQGGEPFRVVNDAAVERLGYSREELLSLRPPDIDPNLSAAVESERLARLDSDTITRFETTHETKSGEHIPVEVSATCVPYRGETAILSTAREVSERVEHERELRRQNERLEELASVVSHDLRNPLNVAAGHLELASEECESAHVDVATNALDRMSGLIDDLLTLTSGDDDRHPVDLGTLVEECWANVATGNARLEHDIDCTIRASESQLAQVFENLFRNSVEHGSTNSRTESGDSVEHGPTNDTQSSAPDSHVVTVGAFDDGFYVADDGVGIPVEDRTRVFESGYSTNENGTGLGLTIVRDVVETHGWEIAVGDSEDGGARFDITGVERIE
ncbi:PAS domain S-box-containing protein [Haloplanus vescus]|uniref:histidine kinase n=1 Tax=Haloplanus vescus TaxID=555874 RepID=A0A1H3W928_9EURY|nr:PAS domain S-box protein [Haloplanus vescus]SDZ83629.1 PAS domain S-box-containing protein [Haloplanus vescus]